ncbi:hypothetical protein DFH28DRAFT_277689 [Melampsora americana]|nr:hypothetical protein DFH28DRAFT_277689 [Melampsora americana]
MSKSDRGVNQTISSPHERFSRWCLDVSSSPWPAWTMSALLLSSLPMASRKTALSVGLPPLWQLSPLAMTFGLGGYITSTGDTCNGSGTTSAWSFIYLFLHGKQSLRHTFMHESKTKISCLKFPWLLTTTAAFNGVVHGHTYWFGQPPNEKTDGVETTHDS